VGKDSFFSLISRLTAGVKLLIVKVLQSFFSEHENNSFILYFPGVDFVFRMQACTNNADPSDTKANKYYPSE
jgi:hypothetical protein